MILFFLSFRKKLKMNSNETFSRKNEWKKCRNQNCCEKRPFQLMTKKMIRQYFFVFVFFEKIPINLLNKAKKKIYCLYFLTVNLCVLRWPLCTYLSYFQRKKKLIWLWYHLNLKRDECHGNMQFSLKIAKKLTFQMAS